MPNEDVRCADSPAALVAIARAAHEVGDRELERAAKRELLDRFGVVLTFARRKGVPRV